MYPPASPTVNGTKITVEQYLKQPTRVERQLNNLALERFLADKIFGKGTAEGGAVIYDRITENSLYLEREVQVIEPGSNFPILNDSDTGANVAVVEKHGGGVIITYEDGRRDRRDKLKRESTRLVNTITRKTDTRALAILDKDPDIPTAAGTDWSDPATRDAIGDIAGAMSQINNSDLGYNTTMAIVNPVQALALFGDKSIRDALPRENKNDNPIASGTINGLMGLTWYESNRVPVGTAWFMGGQQVGSIHDEIPQYTRVVDDQLRERWVIMGARVAVPVVTDPFAAFKLTGL
ncbi:MAG: major capsid protein [Burkholderiaceae bacterium]